MRQGRREILIDGSTRRRRHSLQLLQNNPRLEIRELIVNNGVSRSANKSFVVIISC